VHYTPVPSRDASCAAAIASHTGAIFSGVRSPKSPLCITYGSRRDGSVALCPWVRHVRVTSNRGPNKQPTSSEATVGIDGGTAKFGMSEDDAGAAMQWHKTQQSGWPLCCCEHRWLKVRVANAPRTSVAFATARLSHIKWSLACECVPLPKTSTALRNSPAWRASVPYECTEVEVVAKKNGSCIRGTKALVA
jgi:hypothetical protein